jgi:hypothetical protein
MRYFLPWEQLDMYGNYWRRELRSQIPTSQWMSTDCYVMSYIAIGRSRQYDGRYWITKSIIGINGHISFPSAKEAMAAQDAIMRADGNYLIDKDEVERFKNMTVLF